MAQQANPKLNGHKLEACAQLDRSSKVVSMSPDSPLFSDISGCCVFFKEQRNCVDSVEIIDHSVMLIRTVKRIAVESEAE